MPQRNTSKLLKLRCRGNDWPGPAERPALLQPGQYQKYVHYNDSTQEEKKQAERRGDGRRLRRQKRRERSRAEHAAESAAAVASGASPRDLMRAVRVLEKAAADPAAYAYGGSGTIAARTRSIVKAAGLDPESVGGSGDEGGDEAGPHRHFLLILLSLIPLKLFHWHTPPMLAVIPLAHLRCWQLS